VVTERSSFDPN